MIVRELLAVFGIQYDAAGERAASRGIKGLQKQMDALQRVAIGVFGAVAIASPFYGLVKLSNAAAENLNLLQVMFGESADTVVAWSAKTGAAMGRSRYTMRELAAEFGGLVGAMVGPGEQAANMSMQLSQLAVDLSSLRNIGEQRALTVLTSGLAGETESIKRFGVDLSVAAQEAEALRMGLQGKYQDLDKARKAQVRYNIIMRDLAMVHGDAAKTIDQFANSERALRDILKDIGTDLGFFFLPPLEDTMKTIREGLVPLRNTVRSFKDWAAETNLAKGALLGVGLIIGTLLLPLLLKLLPLLVAFGIFALVMDEVITTFEGGDSVLSRFSAWLDKIDKGLPGIGGKILKFMFWPLNRLRDILGAVGVLFAGLMESIQSGSFTPLKYAIEGLAASATQNLLGKAQDQAQYLSTMFVQGHKEIFAGVKGFLGTGGSMGPSAEMSSLTSARSAAPVQIARQEDNTFNFAIQQLPGESWEDLAKAIGTEVTKELNARDQDLLHELVPSMAE